VAHGVTSRIRRRVANSTALEASESSRSQSSSEPSCELQAAAAL
jgi:hypothetical protein